jgi:hypothetical protein
MLGERSELLGSAYRKCWNREALTGGACTWYKVQVESGGAQRILRSVTVECQTGEAPAGGAHYTWELEGVDV